MHNPKEKESLKKKKQNSTKASYCRYLHILLCHSNLMESCDYFEKKKKKKKKRKNKNDDATLLE